MKCIHGFCVFLMVAVAAGVAGCSSGGGSAPSSSSSTPARSGSVYVLGTDAPLPSVVSFAVNVQSITLSNGTATPVSNTERRADGRFCALQWSLNPA